MLVAVFALAMSGFVQEPNDFTPGALADLEACVDRVEGRALCRGLDEETARAESCMASPEDNATHNTLNACVVRRAFDCLERQPEATVDSPHTRWCMARARGGVRNAVLRKLHAETPEMPEATQRQVWDLYGQAVARIEHLAQTAPKGDGEMMKTAAWIILAHGLTTPEQAQGS